MKESGGDRSARLSLGALIDLEYQLHQDRSRSRGALNERDQAIAERIGAPSLGDRVLLVRWLDALPASDAARPGRRIESMLDTARALAVVVGLLFGGAAVAGWLSLEGGKPINAIHFWGALIGSQVVMLALLGVAAVSSSSLRQRLLAPTRLVGTAITWVASRCVRSHRQALGFAAGLVRQYNRVYGRLRVLLLLQLTQLFATAMNIGFIFAFVTLALVSDPAFGWRSTLLDAGTVHRLAQIIALPWSWFYPAATLTLEEVQATRYWSLDPTFIAQFRVDRAAALWAAWWPFLLASLAFYGLLPRLSITLVCAWRIRRALAAMPPEHASVADLRQRLRRPRVDTRAVSGEPAAPAVVHVSTSSPGPIHADRVILLAWAGVTAGDDELRRLVQHALGSEVHGMHRVGSLDVQADQKAREAVARAPAVTTAALVVEAWEPPVADYLDFIRELRACVGPERLIAVLLYHRDTSGHAIAAREEQLQQWGAHLQAIGDPYLRVGPLVVEEAGA